jgi:hypothetical protein
VARVQPISGLSVMRTALSQVMHAHSKWDKWESHGL